jgi:hypothetical protein
MPSVARICVVSNCDRPAVSKNMCPAHYERARRGVTELEAPIAAYRPKNHAVPCAVDGCDRRAETKEYCESHYKQVKNYGIEPRALRAWSKQEGDCSVEGCRSAAEKTGLCILHYGQTRDGDVTLYAKRSDYAQGECVVSGCVKERTCAILLCKQHETISKQYKLTSIQLQMLWDGGCMICGSYEDLHIDHDHSCCPGGKKRHCGNCNRGCLCRRCNWGLGWFDDDIDKMKSAIAYLSA